MGLFSKLRAEFVDIIEWLDDTNHTLVWRFPRYHNQIKNGAQLIVRPGQIAVFVTEGQIADLFEPGMHTLETNNLPILSTLKGWKHGFDSPFKSEVYFVSTRVLTDLKWGDAQPRHAPRSGVRTDSAACVRHVYDAGLRRQGVAAGVGGHRWGV